MRRRSQWIALVTAIGLALAISAPTFAYVHQTPKVVIVSPSRGTMRCGHYYTVKATVLDKKGKPVRGVNGQVVLQALAIAQRQVHRHHDPDQQARLGVHQGQAGMQGPATA